MRTDLLDPGDRDIPDLSQIDYATITLDGTTLTMTGEIDTTVIYAWRRHYPATPVVTQVEAGGVTYINSAGLAYLIMLVKVIAPTRLTVHAAHPAVRRPLELMGIATLMDLTD